MKASEAVIAWSPANAIRDQRGWETPGQVKICPKPPRSAVDGFAYWVYAGAGTDQPEIARVAMVFIHFNTVVVRDDVDPKVAHEAFLAIDEYRQRISPDLWGAD